MLSGENPFRDSEADITELIRNKIPDDLRTFRAEVPRKLAEINAKMLEKEPGLRYQSVGRLVQDLRLVCNEDSQVATKSRIQPKVQVNWTRLLGFLILAGLLVWVGYSLATGNREQNSPLPLTTKVEPIDLSFIGVPDVREQVPIYLETIPSGAEVTLFPLNERGFPVRTHALKLGRSPISAKVLPGDYFVVASKDQLFHEVLRRIPEPGDARSWYPHLRWKFVNDVAHIYKIKLFDSEKIMRDREWIQADQFAISMDETTTELYLNGKVLMADPKNHQGKVTNLNFDQAAAHVEKMGFRLPFYHELQEAFEDHQPQDEPEILEWTMTVREQQKQIVNATFKKREARGTQLDEMKVAWFDIFGAKGSISKKREQRSPEVGFRAVRSLRPLQPAE